MQRMKTIVKFKVRSSIIPPRIPRVEDGYTFYLVPLEFAKDLSEMRLTLFGAVS